MIEFDVATADSPLGARHMAAGNTEKCAMRFVRYLEPGVIINSATTSTDSLTATSTTPATLTPDKQALHFLIAAPTPLETFTVTVQVVLSDGQILNYTTEITVRAP